MVKETVVEMVRCDDGGGNGVVMVIMAMEMVSYSTTGFLSNNLNHSLNNRPLDSYIKSFESFSQPAIRFLYQIM